MFFDAHTHTQFAAFTEDYRDVIERALKKNVWLINVGTQQDTSRRAVELTQEWEKGVFAAVGLHPIHTSRSYHDEQELGAAPPSRGEPRLGFVSRREEFDYDAYKTLALDSRVVAIGECGLDYYRVDGAEAKTRQEEIFLKHMELAHEVGKPLMIHCRNAFGDLIRLLKDNSMLLNSPPGVLHFFSGTKEDAQELFNLGFYFTFGGVVTFARDYDDIIQAIPRDRIFSETDAPYVTPAPYRGERNEPAYVIEVVKKLAEIKGITAEEMEKQIFENAKKLFRI